MTATTTPPARPAPGPGPRRRAVGRRRRPRTAAETRRTILRASLLGLACYVLGNLLLGGLTLLHSAGVAQRELTAVKDSAGAGDMPAAAAHLRRARRAVDRAAGAAHSGPMRLVGLVPALRPTYVDVDHLLAAVDDVTDAGEDAFGVYDRLSGGDAFANSTVDMGLVRDAQESFGSARTSLSAAVAELRQVRGDGPLGSTAVRKRDVALAQVVPLLPKVAKVAPLVRALPSVLGAPNPRTYLVAIMNPAEMRASGGAPLSVAFIRFDHGRMTIPLKGVTSDLTNVNQKTDWVKLPGDPWQPKGPQRFVNTNFNPSFPVAAQQMLRASPSNFRGIEPDGVIGLDVVTIQKMLEATGPIEVRDFGTLDASNVIQKLLIDGYTTDPAAVAARHDVNEQLMTIMLSRFTEGGGLLGKVKALLAAVPGRHLQAYSTDPRLQRLVLDQKLGGVVPSPGSGNLTAVYTQNTNQSKTDIFQQRTVNETVRLRADGSATVQRTVTLTNAAPPYVGTPPDPKIGYETRWAGAQVINLMPPGARVVSSPTASAPGAATTVVDMPGGVDQDGRTFAQARVLMPPGGSVALTWRYVVDRAALPAGGGLALTDVVAPQANLTPATVHLTVLPPAGWTVSPAAGWTAGAGGAVTTTTAADDLRTFRLQVVPAG